MCNCNQLEFGLRLDLPKSFTLWKLTQIFLTFSFSSLFWFCTTSFLHFFLSVLPSTHSLLCFFHPTVKSLRPSPQKLVERLHLSPVQHSPHFCLLSSAHRVVAAAILRSFFFLFASHTDLLNHIVITVINILPSMTALHPLSCHVSLFPFVTSLFFVCFSLSSCVLIYFAE